jgi:uroporphyrinogen-III synthase
MCDRILITRPVSQAEKTAQWFKEQGVDSFCFPLLDITQAPPSLPLDTLVNKEAYDHIIFISANAVLYSLTHYQMLPTASSHKVWAIGEATALALEESGIQNVLCVQGAQNSEALLAAELLQNVKGKRILIYRGQGGRQHLASELAKRGAQVEYCETYIRQAITNVNLNNRLQSYLTWSGSGGNIAVLVLSVETLSVLHKYIGRFFPLGIQPPIIVPSMRVKREAQRLGFVSVYDAPSAKLSHIYQTFQQL